MKPSQNAHERKRRSDRNQGMAIRIAASDLRRNRLVLTAESDWPKGKTNRILRMTNAEVDAALAEDDA